MLFLLLLLLLPPPQLGTGSPEQQKNPEYQVQLQKLVVVQEGLCALVPCSFNSSEAGRNDSAVTTSLWLSKNAGHPKNVLVATGDPDKKVLIKSSLRLVGDPRAHNCTLSITAPQRRESGLYFLQLSQTPPKHKTWMALHVTALTRTPTIHIDKPLQSGQHSSLRCSLPGACAHAGLLTVSWRGEALEPPGLVPNSSEIQLAPRPQDHGTQLTCRVTVPGANVSTEQTITLNVSYPPQSLTLNVFRGRREERRELDHSSSVMVEEGEFLDLICDARSNPPPKLSWVWRGKLLSPSQTSSAGVLELRPVEQHHEGEFTCRAEHPRGSLQASLHLSVGTPPQLLGPSCSWEAPSLRCSCSARARPTPVLCWWLDQGLLQENHSNASFQVNSNSQGSWANSSLSLWEGFGTGLTVHCKAQNDHGAQSSSVLLLPGQPKLGQGVVLGAFGGAGVAGLLALCLCFLVFIVKACKKGSSEKRASHDEAPVPSVPTSLETHQGRHRGPLGIDSTPASTISRSPVTSGHCMLEKDFQLKSLLSGSPDLPVTASDPQEESELHYAALSFQGLRPCTPMQEATSTEYAEIRTHSDCATSSKDSTVHGPSWVWGACGAQKAAPDPLLEDGADNSNLGGQTGT